jgi:hypothetical protein
MALDAGLTFFGSSSRQFGDGSVLRPSYRWDCEGEGKQARDLRECTAHRLSFTYWPETAKDRSGGKLFELLWGNPK